MLTPDVKGKTIHLKTFIEAFFFFLVIVNNKKHENVKHKGMVI